MKKVKNTTGMFDLDKKKNQQQLKLSIIEHLSKKDVHITSVSFNRGIEEVEGPNDGWPVFKHSNVFEFSIITEIRNIKEA